METILFCAGAPNPDFQNIKKLNPTLIVGVDGGVTQLLKHNISPDIAIGDFDSTDVPNECKVIQLSREKDETDLQYALHYILLKYNPIDINKIIILGALNGGRLDHLICNLWLIYEDFLTPFFNKLYFFEKQNTIRFFSPGNYTLFKEWNKKYLSFILMNKVENLTLQEVKYPLFSKNYNNPIALISNEFEKETMHFSFSKGLIIVIQSNDNNSSRVTARLGA